jgi:hypothetical protein
MAVLGPGHLPEIFAAALAGFALTVVGTFWQVHREAPATGANPLRVRPSTVQPAAQPALALAPELSTPARALAATVSTRVPPQRQADPTPWVRNSAPAAQETQGANALPVRVVARAPRGGNALARIMNLSDRPLPLQVLINSSTDSKTLDLVLDPHGTRSLGQADGVEIPEDAVLTLRNPNFSDFTTPVVAGPNR